MKTNLPLISCVCPTFGKTKHLNEAVQSFLIQTYPNKELIIFNNYPRMDVEFDHPQVKVINYKEPIASIGACRNEGNKYAQGDYICTWDDDDISLARRLDESINGLISEKIRHGGMSPKAVVINAAYSEKNEIKKVIDKFLSGSTIERQYLIDNPYLEVDDDDQYMYNKMLEEKLMYDLKTSEPQYIYRWATGTFHVSGMARTVENQREAMMNYADSSGLPSHLKLTPYWERDYQADVNSFVKSNIK